VEYNAEKLARELLAAGLPVQSVSKAAVVYTRPLTKSEHILAVEVMRAHDPQA